MRWKTNKQGVDMNRSRCLLGEGAMRAGGAHAIDGMVSTQFDKIWRGCADRFKKGGGKRRYKKQFKSNNYGRILLPVSDGDANRMGDDGGNGDAKGVNCFDSPIASSARSRISSAWPSRVRSESVPVRDSRAVVGTWIP